MAFVEGASVEDLRHEIVDGSLVASQVRSTRDGEPEPKRRDEGAILDGAAGTAYKSRKLDDKNHGRLQDSKGSGHQARTSAPTAACRQALINVLQMAKAPHEMLQVNGPSVMWSPRCTRRTA